jgi:probable rRNA maturation factor
MSKVFVGYETYGIEGVDEEYINFVFDLILSYVAADTQAEVGLVVASNNNIQALNHKYRGKNKATNVLSFTNEEIDGFIEPLEGDNYLGDIYISQDYLAQEAYELNLTHKERFTQLFIHGVLHLLGFDHEDEKDAEVMQNMEDKIWRVAVE